VDLHKMKALHPRLAGWEQPYSWWFNSDGLVGGGDSRATYTYVQFFRNGSLEVGFDIFPHAEPTGGLRVLLMEDWALHAAQEYPPVLQVGGASYPLSFLASLVGVKGFRAASAGWYRNPLGNPADRDLICLPDVVFESEEEDAHGVLRPVFDALWQCWGQDRSPSYGADGEWTRPQTNR
jgi:hypothetical protein